MEVQQDDNCRSNLLFAYRAPAFAGCAAKEGMTAASRGQNPDKTVNIARIHAAMRKLQKIVNKPATNPGSSGLRCCLRARPPSRIKPTCTSGGGNHAVCLVGPSKSGFFPFACHTTMHYRHARVRNRAEIGKYPERRTACNLPSDHSQKEKVFRDVKLRERARGGQGATWRAANGRPPRGTVRTIVLFVSH